MPPPKHSSAPCSQSSDCPPCHAVVAASGWKRTSPWQIMRSANAREPNGRRVRPAAPRYPDEPNRQRDVTESSSVRVRSIERERVRLILWKSGEFVRLSQECSPDTPQIRRRGPVGLSTDIGPRARSGSFVSGSGDRRFESFLASQTTTCGAARVARPPDRVVLSSIGGLATSGRLRTRMASRRNRPVPHLHIHVNGRVGIRFSRDLHERTTGGGRPAAAHP